MENNFYSEIDSLLEIYNSNQPINQNGTFDPDKVKTTIIQMCTTAIKNEEERNSLLTWMESNEYYTSPASSRFHGNVKGGLAAHSLLVCKQALYYANTFMSNFECSKRAGSYQVTAEDIFIAAICHDLCKAGFYGIEFRKTKDISGNWINVPYYKVKNENRGLGHGNESVLLTLESMPSVIKRRHVIEAISRHMGFSDLAPSEEMNYSNFLQNPLVLLIQIADETAAQWWDV